MSDSVFIIIPAYNEQDNIGQLLEDLKVVSTILPLGKVILVNDGSTDKTEEIARSFLNQLNLEIITHRPNKGVAEVFRDGLNRASALAAENDVIVIIEGDGTSDLKILPAMVEQIKTGADVVIASRYIKGGAYKNFPLKRLLGSHGVNFILKVFFHIKNVSDYTIFYRAYRAKVVKQAIEKYGNNFITTRSFAANAEILIKVGEFCQKLGAVPFVYDYGLKKGSSKIRIVKTLLEYKKLIFRK